MGHRHLLRVLGFCVLLVLFVTGGVQAQAMLLSGRPAAGEGNEGPHLPAAASALRPFDTALPRASLPSGQTWVVETLESVGTVGQYASLALDTAGWAHISYFDSDNGDLKYIRFDGSAWVVETVDSAGIVGLYTSLALDSAGWPHIGYFDFVNLAVKYAHWGGAAWQIETVESGLGLAGGYVSLALDLAGFPHITYYNGTSGDLKYARWDGSAWQIQTVESPGYVGQYSSLALDSADLPHVSYYDSSNGDLKYAHYDGLSWQIQPVDSAGDVGLWTSLTLDGADLAHISYYDGGNGDLKYARWDGSAWQIETVENVGDVGQYTSLALDAADFPHISYYDGGNGDLKYARWDGSSWQVQVVDSAGDVGQYTSLALDTVGRPSIGYYDAAAADLKYAYICTSVDGASISGPASLPAGQTGVYAAASIPFTASLPITYTWGNGTVGPTAAYSWTTPGVYTVTVTATNACGAGSGAFTVTVCAFTPTLWVTETVDSVGNVGQYTSLALDSMGYPHISYFDGTNYDLKYAWNDGSTWYSQAVDSVGDVGQYSSLVLDPAGYPRISYYASWPDLDLKYAWYDGSTWYLETVDSTGDVGWYTALALDADGWPHISYHDHTNRDLKYAWKDGLGWHWEVVDGAGDVGYFTSLALDGMGYPHISYMDSSNGDLKYAWYDGSLWSLETVAGAIGMGPASYTSLKLDSAGWPHLTYYDAANGELRYAYYDGSDWWIQTLDSTGDAGWYSSLALSSDDRPSISYYLSWPSHDLKHANYSGCAWQSETVDGTGDTGLYTSLALDGSALPYISYYDNTSADLRYAFACVRVEDVAIAGLDFLLAGTTALYTATYTPTSATLVRLTWDNGVVGPTAAYSWTMPGHYTVTVTATNGCSAVTDTLAVEVCQEVEGLSVSGPAFLLARETGVYTASYSPPTVTLPITLTWDNGTLGPVAAYSWTMPGFYTITVSATNACGEVHTAFPVEVCQPVEGIAVVGPAGLPVGATGLYTATYTPPTATLPVTFTWNNGTVSPTATYSWTVPGIYTLTVTATNACAELHLTVTVAVCWAVEGADMGGPTNLRTGETGIYTATYTPLTATLPVTITWDNGTVGPTAAYSWPMPGTFMVVVTATNICSHATAGLAVQVCQPVQDVQVSGPPSLLPGETGNYSAQYTPLNASPPVTIIWDNGTVGPTASYSWALPGTYAVAVTATNPCGEADGGLTVIVSGGLYQVYLPLVLRDW